MKKRVLSYALILSMTFSGVFALSACSKSEPEAPTVTEKVEVKTNPLTGETAEQGFDEDALNRRVAAIVVENTYDARPQWGMDDANYSPDIMLQGEVEGGITRTLWMYADYNKLPEIIGPMRSARPPYIRFSELFDSIFVHWGQSSSKGDYVGASTVFEKDNVDHINQMTFDDTVGLYDRDHTRSTSAEHRGIIYGAKLPAAIEAEGFRTEPNEYTKLDFSDLADLTTFSPATDISVTYSARTNGFNTDWTYNAEDKKYHTADFKNDFTRDNLLVLYDQTEYIDKLDYGGNGYTLTYCDYKFAGGKGVLMTHGMSKEVEWKVEGGKLVLIDVNATKVANENAKAYAKAKAEKNEEEYVEPEPIVVNASFNTGKTWIGWISENNGGSLVIK